MHDPSLVLLSVAIATLASYTALDLAGRIRATTGRASWLWLAAAAIAMGGGIWSMHFVAMLAFSMDGMDVAYDAGLTLLSLALAIVVTGAAFAVVSRPRANGLTYALSGLFMGTGIFAMHYTGMAAMRMDAAMLHDPAWRAAAYAIAVGASWAALLIAFRATTGLAHRLAAAVVMGLAIAGMHYVGMMGTTFAALHPAHAGHGMAGAMAGMAGGVTGGVTSDLTRASLLYAVAGSTLVILAMALGAAMVDRRFVQLAERETSALRRSEERFRDLYRDTPLPLHALCPEGRIELVSDAWLDLLGYARAEVVGRPLSDFMEECSAREHAAAPEGGLGIERRFRARSGEILDVLLSTRVGADPADGGRRILGGLVDVTARRQAEAQLRQSQKIEAIGQLTGGVAHDFNNLLAATMGNLELLRRHVREPRAERLLDGALQGVQRGAALTQRLLAFSRRQDLRPEPVRADALVEGIGALLDKAAGPTVTFTRDFAPDLRPAQVDANQLELALVNLVVNARDAMPDGGAIAIRAGNAAVRPGTGRLPPGAYVRIEVEDAGCGMDAATLARASEPFFTTKGVGKGTGLGLSMVQGLAEQSGGCLELRSEPGRGTVAALWLPAATDGRGAAPRAERQAADVPGGEGRRVLVVDDDALVLMSTAEMLGDLGYETVEAGSGAEALARIGEGAFDLVVTDQAMPGMTGLQLVERVREACPGLPVLLASGYAEVPGIEAVPVPVLPKPFRQDVLARTAARCIREAAGNRMAAE